jgi:hypothetical protein
MMKSAKSTISDIKRLSLSKIIIVTSPKREIYAFVLSVNLSSFGLNGTCEGSFERSLREKNKDL